MFSKLSFGSGTNAGFGSAPKTNPYEPEVQDPHAPPFIIVFLAIFAVSIAFYLTAKGYMAMLGAACWAFAFILCMAMLYMEREIWHRRMKQEPIKYQVMLFCLAAIPSFFGNFNALFSNMAGRDLYEEELQSYRTALETLYPQAVSKVNESGTLTKSIEDKVNLYKKRFEDEVRNQANPGLGKVAEGHLREIESLLLGERINMLSAVTDREKILENVRQEIDRIIQTKKQGREELVTGMTAKYNKAIRLIDKNEETLATANLAFDYDDRIKNQLKTDINTIYGAYKGLRASAQAYLKTDFDKDAFPERKPAHLNVGHISHSVANMGILPWTTFVAVVFSLILDFFVLALIFGASAPDENRFAVPPPPNRKPSSPNPNPFFK